MTRFAQAVESVLREEGGYVHNPVDAGGATNMGVSDAADGKKDGQIDLDRDGMGDIDPRELTREQAIAYYKTWYWHPTWEELPSQDLATSLLDCAVNQGQGTAIRLLQEALCALGYRVKVDGVFGSATLSAVIKSETEEPGMLIRHFRAKRAIRYVTRVLEKPDQMAFLHGWLSRAVI